MLTKISKKQLIDPTRTYFLLFSMAVLLLSWGCNDAIKRQSFKEDSIMQVLPADSTVNVDEAQDFSGYPIDSMDVYYGKNKYRIRGYLVGDILIAEGDIAFSFPGKEKRAVGSTWRIWPVNGDRYIIIPYTISQAYPHPERIRAAMSMWEAAVHIRFVPRTSETDYVDFVPSTGSTWSSLGRTGRRQTINLQSGRMSGNIAHEIGHALGLYHEQARCDRDQYINVLCPNNLQYRIAFKRDPYARDYGPYNYYSIMHYVTGKCMKVRNRPTNMPASIPGQRDSITYSDALAIRQIYNVE